MYGLTDAQLMEAQLAAFLEDARKSLDADKFEAGVKQANELLAPIEQAVATLLDKSLPKEEREPMALAVAVFAMRFGMLASKAGTDL